MHTSDQVKECAQYGALSRYIANEISLDAAINEFCSDVEAKFQETGDGEALEEPLWEAWRAVVTMAASLPPASESRQQLVDFVLEVQKRPNLEKDGEPCVVQGGKAWEDFPIFGMEMREAWNLAATNDSSTRQQDMWINLNAWTATLVASVQSRGLSAPDFSLYCIWTVRTALEQEDTMDTALEAAAVWFTYASSSIYQLCLAGKTFDGKVAKPGSLFSDREWRGFSQHRWAAWMRQMDKAGQSASDGRAAGAVADAGKSMKVADGASHPRT